MPASGPFKRSELHEACIDSDIDSVARLAKDQVQVRTADANGWTPLHFAAQSQSAEVVRVLLDAGADVNARDLHGNTPLFRAVFAYRGDGTVVSLLLKAGANPDQPNQAGVSARKLAQTITNYDVSRYFK